MISPNARTPLAISLGTILAIFVIFRITRKDLDLDYDGVEEVTVSHSLPYTLEKFDTDVYFEVLGDLLKTEEGKEAAKDVVGKFGMIITRSGDRKLWMTDLKDTFTVYQTMEDDGNADSYSTVTEDYLKFLMNKDSIYLDPAYISGNLKVSGRLFLTRKLSTLMNLGRIKYQERVAQGKIEKVV